VAGTILARKGKYAEAAEAFGRQAAGGGGPEAVNNRAYMLVLAGDPATAGGLVEAAIAEAGPTPGLLDTRGAARRVAGQVAGAVSDAESAVEQEPTAVRCLHLAEAYLAAGRPKDVLTALARATKLQATAPAFLPAEQAAFERVTAELRSPK
jgi:predicted Zn-dependent protease